MKTKRIITNIILLTIFPIFFSWAQPVTNKNSENITGPYFDEPFPSTTVTRFAPTIFTEEFHAPPIFSPDGTEVYWAFMGSDYQHILYMKLENGVWSEPAVAPFCIGDYTDSPFITSDGTKLFFLTMNQPAYEESICMVEKQNGEWGTPQILSDEVNYIDPHWQASVADNQNLYFGGRLGNSAGDVYFSEYVNGSYTTAQKLGPAINKLNAYESSPFIAPDESYLIFDRVADGTYDADLFISFKQNDGSWSEAVYMSELNTGGHELYANVSPDGRFMMFLSGRTGILLPYWVDAQVIHNYTTDVDEKKNVASPESFQLYQNFPNPFNPVTTIRYYLPKALRVKLTIFNVHGQEIKTLVNGNQIPGNKSVVWDGTDNSEEKVSSGVYTSRINAGDITLSKKMLFIK